MDSIERIQNKIAGATKKIFVEAIETIAQKLPNDDAKEKFVERLKENSAKGIDAALNGQDYQKYIKRGAYETSVWLANHYVDAALKNYVYEELPEGETRDKISEALNELAHKGIEAFCRGETLEKIKSELATITKSHLKKYVEEQSKIIAKQSGQKIYAKFKFKGEGSRKKNQYLKKGTNLFADEFAVQITDNFGAWIDGEKDFGEAFSDIAVNTGKNTAVEYTKKYGAEIAADTAKHLATLAEKKIKNELLRDGTVKVLNKLANANVITSVVGVGIDFKKFWDGEISFAEFLRRAGEEGTSAVVSGACASLSTMIVGKSVTLLSWTVAGGVIGAAVGYFATKIVYDSVLKSFEELERSRKEYEAFHGFCERVIPEMKRQRLEFQRAVKEFLNVRQQTFDDALKQYDSAVKVGDTNSVIVACDKIAEGRLPYKNERELDMWMRKNWK